MFQIKAGDSESIWWDWSWENCNLWQAYGMLSQL
jgi:hypothetical protein